MRGLRDHEHHHHGKPGRRRRAWMRHAIGWRDGGVAVRECECGGIWREVGAGCDRRMICRRADRGEIVGMKT